MVHIRETCWVRRRRRGARAWDPRLPSL